LGHQCAVRESDFDPAGQRRHGRIGAIDPAIAADGLDPVEVVGIGDLG
jgi:hypothetical protein